MSAVHTLEHVMSPESHLRPQTVTLGGVAVSRFILGGNPFGGFAHQTRARDEEMADWYTMERVKECYRLAEESGVTTHLGRADEFIKRALREHWNEGGKLTWIAQTCPEVGTIDLGIRIAIHGRAKCCFIHGGEMDFGSPAARPAKSWKASSASKITVWPRA